MDEQTTRQLLHETGRVVMYVLSLGFVAALFYRMGMVAGASREVAQAQITLLQQLCSNMEIMEMRLDGAFDDDDDGEEWKQRA